MEKEYLTIDEFCSVTGYSKSSVYKFTSKRLLGFFKPSGKRILISKQQLSDFLTKNRFKSQDEFKEESLSKQTKFKRRSHE